MSLNASVRPDINYSSTTGDNPFGDRRDFTDVNGSDYATVVKLSDGIHGQTITGLRVNNGHETSVDMDWATDMTIGGDFGLGPQLGDNVIRSKGPYDRIKYFGTAHSRGQRNGDIELGNHFDQHPGLGGSCDLTGMLPHADGLGPNTVTIGWVRPFATKLGPNCKQLFWASAGLKVYVATKHLIRWALRIPAGVKGPSWF